MKMKYLQKNKVKDEISIEEQSEINTNLKPNNYNFSSDKFENNIPSQKQNQNENINIQSSNNINFEQKESQGDNFFHDSENDED